MMGNKETYSMEKTFDQYDVLKIILAMKRSGAPYNEAVFADSRRRYLLKNPLLRNVTPGVQP